MHDTHAYSNLPVGGVGFIIEATPQFGALRRTLDALPGRTNHGGIALARGWLGTTDNLHVEAVGLGRVVQELGYHSKRPWEAGRVKFELVETTDDLLETLGYDQDARGWLEALENQP